jgi:hypothetical protein
VVAIDDIFVEGVLEVSPRRRGIEALHVGLVLAEQQLVLGCGSFALEGRAQFFNQINDVVSVPTASK